MSTYSFTARLKKHCWIKASITDPVRCQVTAAWPGAFKRTPYSTYPIGLANARSFMGIAYFETIVFHNVWFLITQGKR